MLSSLSSDVAGVSVCPPVALDSGVGLLCRLFEQWGQVPAGVLALTEWLLGDEESNDEAVTNEPSSLVRIRHVTQECAGICLWPRLRLELECVPRCIISDHLRLDLTSPLHKQHVHHLCLSRCTDSSGQTEIWLRFFVCTPMRAHLAWLHHQRHMSIPGVNKSLRDLTADTYWQLALLHCGTRTSQTAQRNSVTNLHYNGWHVLAMIPFKWKGWQMDVVAVTVLFSGATAGIVH